MPRSAFSSQCARASSTVKQFDPIIIQRLSSSQHSRGTITELSGEVEPFLDPLTNVLAHTAQYCILLTYGQTYLRALNLYLFAIPKVQLSILNAHLHDRCCARDRHGSQRRTRRFNIRLHPLRRKPNSRELDGCYQSPSSRAR